MKACRALGLFVLLHCGGNASRKVPVLVFRDVVYPAESANDHSDEFDRQPQHNHVVAEASQLSEDCGSLPH